LDFATAKEAGVRGSPFADAIAAKADHLFAKWRALANGRHRSRPLLQDEPAGI
jgi:hypothetical protein